ncbi:hypothetical protein BGZ63DRAFT_8790 [Mariannaea sp. PMI_226]|nr:hypothetical protein BGZ63DRAFT_8790 [Mariannaea sp. PMI_226]
MPEKYSTLGLPPLLIVCWSFLDWTHAHTLHNSLYTYKPLKSISQRSLIAQAQLLRYHAFFYSRNPTRRRIISVGRYLPKVDPTAVYGESRCARYLGKSINLQASQMTGFLRGERVKTEVHSIIWSFPFPILQLAKRNMQNMQPKGVIVPVPASGISHPAPADCC